MKNNYSIIPISIAFVLFFIPFFWLGRGELDLGGDSSRLYFYDPAWYLQSSTLYGISLSGFGLENINYLAIPFIYILSLLRQLMSPTMLLVMFHGFSLSASFIFVYLIIRNLGRGENDVTLKISAIVGGLFYALSPALILGWQYVLITRNQLFLNPIIFYLFLRYFITSNYKYIFVSLLLSFIFSPNFSVVAAPPFFAFYPISVLFLMAYTKIVLRKKINWRYIGLGLFLFVLLQLFHLGPQLNGILSKDSSIHATIFTTKGMYDRGLSYFLGIAPNIKASINLFGLPQMTELGVSTWGFVLFPFVLVFGLFFNKNKLLPLLTMFFMFVLFFATANITNLGFDFYRMLFNIPGFSMFRNFYGQWQFSYIFYYALLIGLSLSIVLSRLKKSMAGVLVSILVGALVVNAVPFIRGDILKKPLWQSNDVSPIIAMDPLYEEMLSVIRNLPHDGKILTLPLTDPGYQVVGGKNGGAYVGPSTIAYLTGKQDFSGYEEFWEYKNIVLHLFKTGQIEEVKKILGFFNIKYIFYNADPGAYDAFPAFPFIHVRKFLPENQKEYKNLIQSLELVEIKNIENKYFLYELNENYLSPHILVHNEIAQVVQDSFDITVPLSMNASTNYLNFIASPQDTIDLPFSIDLKITQLTNRSTLLDLFKNSEDTRLPWGFVSQSLDSFLYPLIVAKEQYGLNKISDVNDAYIDKSILYAEKRVNELLKNERGIGLLENITSIAEFSNKWKSPSLYMALGNAPYNYWEVSLVRYFQSINLLIEKIYQNNASQYSIVTNQALVNRMMVVHKERVFSAIRGNKDFSEQQKMYLVKLVVDMFSTLSDNLALVVPNADVMTYDIGSISEGIHDLLIEKSAIDTSIGDAWEIKIGNKVIPSQSFVPEGKWYAYPRLTFSENSETTLELRVTKSTNLIKGDQWNFIQQNNNATVSTNAPTDEVKLSFSNGLHWIIPNISSDSYYYISFQYNTNGKDFVMNWYEKDNDNLSMGKNTMKEELVSSEWKTYKGVIKTGVYANEGLIEFTKDGSNTLIDALDPSITQNAISIKNLTLLEVPNPKVIIRTAISENSVKQQNPTVTYQKINPTKYVVRVSGITKDFYVMLAQKFNPRWKIYDMTEEYTGKQWKDQAKNYTFLSASTFESWQKKSLQESRHFEINGYGNGWYIPVEDHQNSSEKYFVIELNSQKIFYVSFFVSIIAFIFCCYMLIRPAKSYV